MTDALNELIADLGRSLAARGLWLGTAESCTGGLIAASLTDVAGSSGWFRGAVVAYANEVKQGLLDVPPGDLAAHGAVSEPVVLAMARGACAALGVDCAVAVSGVAGPGGGTPDKPVGTVWIAWKAPGRTWARRFSFAGDRAAVRRATVEAAVRGLCGALEVEHGDHAPVHGAGAAG
ncbi:CinA family protein [Desulfocurvus sp. DL9XJH121]